MGIINVLDISVANLIAAGEVVERPASVVKELLENSIDAGADTVSVDIRHGGVSYIRVSDNGIGMSREDLPVSIKRHATSKIRDQRDLDGIMTLGFRGEALAAISSVAKVTITTRRREDAVGSKLTSEPGEDVVIEECGCPAGTTVVVEELFRNVPARRKFLKRDITEAMAVTAVVEKTALSNPSVSIRYTVEGNLKFDTSGDGKLGNAIYSVLGREFASGLIPVRGMTEGIEINGYTGRPDTARSNRNFENIFLNGRYIKSRTISAALEQAYDSFIPSDRFPSCVLHITVHPAYVDVNVHPTKLEVKFANERMIFDAVYSIIRDTITKSRERPKLSKGGSMSIEDIRTVGAFVPVYDRNTEDHPGRRSEQMLISSEAPPAFGGITEIEKMRFEHTAQAKESDSVSNAAESSRIDETVTEDIPTPEIIKTPVETASTSDSPAPPPDVPRYRIIGEVFQCYVMVEYGEKMLLIDKHAAHERILFEQMKKNMLSGGVHSQMQLFPIDITLSPDEIAAVSEYKDEIFKIGFEFTVSASSGVMSINAVPMELTRDGAADFMVELAGRLAAGTGTVENNREILYEKSLYQASCKAAIKAGQDNDPEHIRWLCAKLFELPDIKYCPHGRPVAIEMTKSQMEKQFGRT